MILQTLQLIAAELKEYFNNNGITILPGDDPIILENVAKLDFGNEVDQNLEDKVIISLVNLEEEKRLKNLPAFTKNKDKVEYKQPPVNLNMYVLFSANCKKYASSLNYLAGIVAFFQGKKRFTEDNSPKFSIPNPEESLREEGVSIMKGLKVKLDLYAEIHTLNFEQINDLWGSLGGKQVPFVMYKMRLIGIDRDLTFLLSSTIETVDGKGTIN